jgi:hypothetical protein
VLYGGLGRHQVERLAALRKASERTWERRAIGKSLAVDFAGLFQDVLTQFDTRPEDFSLQRVQDELVGQMADQLEADYDTLSLEIDDSEARHRVLTSEPSPAHPTVTPVLAPPASPPTPPGKTPPPVAAAVPAAPQTPAANFTSPKLDTDAGGGARPPSGEHDGDDAERLQAHIVSPAATTERLQSIQRLVADQMGDALPDFEANVLRAIPVQAGGLYPISDVWYIEPGLDAPDRLRVHIAQFAREIAEEASVPDAIEPSEVGLGFVCRPPGRQQSLPAFARAVLNLLHALSAASPPAAGLDSARLADDLAPLLHGHGGGTRLGDAGLVKLFRLLRLARRLVDLETGATADPGNSV